jgi:mitogen-activated protein kinase 1/3
LVEVPKIDPLPAPVRTLYVVFDYAGCDLHKLVHNNTVIPLETVKTLMKQMCMATRYLHHSSVIHRDLKPANILIDPKTWRLRIADFGLSRVLDQGQHSAVEDVKIDAHEVNPGVDDGSENEIDDPSASTIAPNLTRQISEHVVTRWYRAPEVILCRGHYGYSIDVWSVGCIFAELLNMCVDQPTTKKRPLFPGRSCFPLSPSSHTCFKDVTDQLNVIFSIIGTPSQDEIDALEAGDDVKTYLARLNPAPPADLSQKFPHADKEALAILKGMLTFLASDRLTLDQALDNPFLASAETPDDVDDETTVNYKPVKLARKSSNLAAQDLLAMDLEHQYDRRNHDEAVKRLSVMFRKEIDGLHEQQRSDAEIVDGEMFHDCPEA